MNHEEVLIVARHALAFRAGKDLTGNVTTDQSIIEARQVFDIFGQMIVALAAPVQPTDSARLDCLSEMTGFVQGTSDGEPSYRIMSHANWHPTLRAAIDEVMAKNTTKNLPLDQESP